ncbi:MAG TPA: hypothetical protein VE912_13850 [Bacteroidales bacterium]|nr:hypothetical protein [Bacteroidales bacterium]
MVYAFFDDSNVSIVTIKKYLQTQYPTYKIRFEELNDIQYLIVKKNLLEKVYIRIKNNTVSFHNIDTIKIKKHQSFYYLLGYIPGLFFKSKKDKLFNNFKNGIIDNMLKDIPKSTYNSDNGSVYIDCEYNNESIEVNEKG